MFIPSDYWCRDNIYSVLLKGVCDSEYIYYNVCVRDPRGARDVTHLKKSSFYKKFMRIEILQKHVVTIGGQQILGYVVGDFVYLILTQI